MTSEFYSSNRKRLMEKLEEGSMVLLYSGIAPVKSHDQDMCPFSVNRNFYYMTGIDTQNVWLLMTKTGRGVGESLFIDEPDEYTIKWNGKMLTREEASRRSGLAESKVHYMQELDSYVVSPLSRLVTGAANVYFSFDRLSMNAAPTRAEEYARTIREKFPMVQIRNIARDIASLRSVKTPEELDCLRRAGDVTIEALRHMLQSARPGEYEYQWQADYEHYVARQGLRHGFETIAASGENAVMLHYSDNNCVAKDGTLLLVDLGAEYKYYYHGVSHSLGLDTHDPCDRTVYESGMVITCEPGLYVAEEGIGIRLENDILVTEGAAEDLIGDRLLDIREIEELMAR